MMKPFKKDFKVKKEKLPYINKGLSAFEFAQKQVSSDIKQEYKAKR